MDKLAKIIGTDGKLPAFAWPGGYPIIYMDADGSELCPDCANESRADPDELANFRPVAYHVFEEGAPMQCAQCSAMIESAYGDPEESPVSIEGD